MVIDTSAVVAILRREQEFEAYLRSITEAGEAYIWPGSRSRTSPKKPLPSPGWLSFSMEKARHRAALNICDCAAYATAKECNLPLLYKGNDFTHTDIPPALP